MSNLVRSEKREELLSPGMSKMKTKEKEEKLENLNLVLRTIRNVTHLLVRERDRTRLLQSICNNLIENRGYCNAWIAVLDESRGIGLDGGGRIGRGVFGPY